MRLLKKICQQMHIKFKYENPWYLKMCVFSTLTDVPVILQLLL